MSSAVYTVEIDFDKDADYDHAASDVTAYVLELRWNNGMTRSEQFFSSPARLSLVLDNSGGDFNLEDSGATFYGLFRVGLLVRVQATFASTTYTLFIGKLAAIPQVDVGVLGAKRATLAVRDLLPDLLDVEFLPRLQTDITTGAALRQPFEYAAIALPYASSYWILGSDTHSTLGVNTILADATAMIDFEAGATTLPYVGDLTNPERETSAQQFLREIVAAELGGRFFYDARQGLFVFHGRYHDVNPSIAASFADADIYDSQYVAQGEVRNDVTIHFQPREVGTAESVLWNQDQAIRLAPGEVRTITASYRDPDSEGVRIGGMDFVIPAAGLDYIANSAEDGGGTNLTSRLGVSAEFGGSKAKITLYSNANQPLYVTLLRVRGTPLRTYQRQYVRSFNANSVGRHDVQPYTESINALADEETAQQYADNMTARYADPVARFERITLVGNKSDALMTQALARTVGDVITVAIAQIDHDADYVIVGEQHRVSVGGEHTHETTWILKQHSRVQYWVLGVTGLSELGTTTILAF